MEAVARPDDAGPPLVVLPRLFYYSLVTGTVGTAGLVALLVQMLGHAQKTSVWLAFLVLSVVVATFFVAALVSRVWMRVHERLLTTTAGLEDRILGRGPLRVVMHVRGRVDGIWCRVTRRALEVEIPSATSRVLSADALRAIAAGSDDPGLLVFAAKPEARAAASALLAAGKSVTVHLDATKARLLGVTSHAVDAAALARLLAVIARAPALALARASDAACPYCKDEIKKKEAEGTFRCAACDTLHHTPCWNEHGGCAIFGCDKAPAEGRTGTRART